MAWEEAPKGHSVQGLPVQQVLQGQRQAHPTTGDIQDLEELGEHWQEDVLEEGLEEAAEDLMAQALLEVQEAEQRATSRKDVQGAQGDSMCMQGLQGQNGYGFYEVPKYNSNDNNSK